MKIHTLCLIMFGILIWPSMGLADISFTNGLWSTSFDYGQECSGTGQGIGLSTVCDSISNDSVLNWNDIDSNQPGFGTSFVTSAVVAANNPHGDGGNGARFWVNDGSNQGTPNNRITFPQEKEIWVRWYQRYQPGFAWAGGNPNYDKCIYVWSSGPGANGGFALIPEHQSGSFQVWTNTSHPLVPSNPSITWQDVFGTTSDGLFHMFELHLKVNSAVGVADGIVQYWIDGVKYIDYSTYDLTTGSNNPTEALAGVGRIDFHQNQSSPANGAPAYVDYDDMEIWNTTPPNISPDGDAWIGPLKSDLIFKNGFEDVVLVASPPSMPIEVIFNDPIEDNNFASRGWYDNTNQILVNDAAIIGSTKSIEYQYNQGATKPTNGSAMRHKFTASDSVYVSYYVKYSNNWVGSQRSYHPHEFYLLTNKNSDYSGLAFTNLTAYIEQVDLQPRIAIQDGVNIDTGNIDQNLVNITENRAVAGCNGDSDGTGIGDCYSVSNGTYRNGKYWQGSSTISRNVWHRIEAFIKLNSIQNGKGIADGVARYWLDGRLILEREDIMLRTAKHADMLIDQIVIAPYIGDGSPITQTMWVDDLTVGTESPNTVGASHGIYND